MGTAKSIAISYFVAFPSTSAVLMFFAQWMEMCRGNLVGITAFSAAKQLN